MSRHLFSYPGADDFAVDDPRTTLQRRRIIREKAFLRDIYRDWYAMLAAAVDQRPRVLELGSGAGFLREALPRAIASEYFWIPGVGLVCDARSLPVRDASLDALLLVDVLHHIPDVRRFFAEAVRALRPGGRVVMIEPWRTAWSQWIYSRFHDEPFEPDAAWEFASSGPLSGANGALPWIVFSRDRRRFNEEFPELRIVTIRPMMPFRYLFSGGVSRRSLVPGFASGFASGTFRALETMLAPAMGRLAMFAMIVLEAS